MPESRKTSSKRGIASIFLVPFIAHSARHESSSGTNSPVGHARARERDGDDGGEDSGHGSVPPRAAFRVCCQLCPLFGAPRSTTPPSSRHTCPVSVPAGPGLLERQGR